VTVENICPPRNVITPVFYVAHCGLEENKKKDTLPITPMSADEEREGI
jgi:hypothetical protein